MRDARGTILLLALFFMMVATFLAHAFLVVLPTQMNSAVRLGQLEQASLACDSGVQEALAWLEAELASGREPSDRSTRAGALNPAWEWRVVVEPWGGARRYRLLSEAIRSENGQPVRRVTAWVQGGVAFSRWALLADRLAEPLPVRPGLYRGPVHVNGRVELALPSRIYTQGGPPAFAGGLSTSSFSGSPAGDGVLYQGAPPPYEAQRLQVPARYRALYQGGRSGLCTLARRVEIPRDSAPQAAACWRGPLPRTPGVHLQTAGGRLTSGVCVVGDLDFLLLDQDGFGNPSLTLSVLGRRTRIVEVVARSLTTPAGATVPKGNTLVFDPRGETVYGGAPRGVVYCTGNIRALKGCNRGRRTIVADLGAGREIVLSGSVLKADSSGAPADRDALGLVAHRLRLSRSAPRPTLLHAAVLSREVLVEEGHRLIVVGSLAEAEGAAGGRVEPRFDPRLAVQPPPAFPQVRGATAVLSWKEETL